MDVAPESKKAKNLKGDFWDLKNIQISIGEIITEEKPQEEEARGPKPRPHVTDLRSWDMKLLERYEPFYAPFCDMCCLCTYGKCDLLGKKGACGIDAATQQARIVLLACLIGTAAHAGHARHLVDHLIEKLGEDYEIDLGMNVDIEAPITRTVMGRRPRTLGDLMEVMDYAEEQMSHLLSACHTGQEGDSRDFESKAFHAGLMDDLTREVADIAQIVALDLPKGDEDAPLVELGFGTIDNTKPVILCIGHNVLPGADIVDYVTERELEDEVEVCGICCAAIDVTRYSEAAKVVGPLSKQLRFIRSGVADVIVVDEQCVRTDVLEEALKNRSAVIATTDKMCLGLPDVTDEDPDKIVNDLINGNIEGALILDPHKVGEVAVKTAIKLAPIRKSLKKLPEVDEIIRMASECTDCGWCQRVCPNSLPVMDAVKSAAEGDLSKLEEMALEELCYTCGRCEQECERDIPIVSMVTKAGERRVKDEKYKIRAGRGPAQDVEIRRVGAPIVLGDIPGVIAFVGCSNYPEGGKDVALMAKEFLERNYIVVTTGCGAMSIGEYRDEDGKTLYEKYGGQFDAKGLVNMGSCVSNAHISGAAIKIANIFAQKPLEGNFEEIADYILNRVGACGVAWGAYSQKAAAIATGVNRWGIPVVLGPHGSKYRRLFLGRADDPEKWKLNDLRTGEVIDGEPAPEHLLYAAENREEATVMVAKLCIRPTDTPKGRQMKLSNYIDLHKKYFGTIPDDIDRFIRTEKDIPIVYKRDILKILEEKNWKPRKLPKEPSLLER
ncbi:CO dehydrogenase/acetyl-CoA synthase complex subunit epsilon [Methanothermobacter marburgensis]|uniref:CO dehydrogenase/acetyl-CoA synthase complex subunit alpha n=1 Tax=Methanothermobacter marburgensis TaxID=145263 RepID=UPI0022B93C90|nr:CO dehydrogenase/acetyl-CoA synthase complex subunit alpha [Methanothermobacter marburgensis]WBF10635.1 CO dehydrogenase/acetyl-CoA synthase complex subunit epsilon [Methanothermobacter marburgensis]